MYKRILDPRLSFSPTLKRRMQLVVGIGLCALCIWLLYKVPYQMLREERMRAMGETKTSGLVLKKYATETSTKYETPWYLVEYRYRDNSGFTRDDKAVIDKTMWDGLNAGDTIVVWFASGNPGLVRVEGQVESDLQVRLREWLKD